MTLIIIIAAIWGISSLISHARQERLAREQQRQREAQARLLREQRAQAQRQREMEKEQKQMEREQAAAWEKQRKEDAARDAKIAKHEERIFKLEQKLELAQREEEHQDEIVTAIRVDMAGLEAYVNYCKSKGLLCKGKEDELKKKSKELYAAETKLIKARQARELCEKQMSA